MSRGHGMNRNDDALAAALRALPDAAPEPDLWPDLARTIARRRRPRLSRYAWPVAIAATLAIALLAPRLPQRAPDHGTRAAATATSESPAPAARPPRAEELDSLRDRSRVLERWIAAVAARAPQDGRDLMAAVEVEDLIGLVDVQLGGADTESEALPLWRQRVALLEDLATIRGNAFALAENGGDAGLVPASLDRIN